MEWTQKRTTHEQTSEKRDWIEASKMFSVWTSVNEIDAFFCQLRNPSGIYKNKWICRGKVDINWLSRWTEEQWNEMTFID